MATGASYFSASIRMVFTDWACCSCVPWEKFSRTTFIPALIILSRVCGEELEGPIVQIILAFRTIAFLLI
jgi:hypothetical protein